MDAKSSSGAKCTRARPIPDKEWNQHFSRIEQLYLKDNLSLDATVDALNSDGFIVTKRPLKERLQKWELFKYIPQDDAEVIVSLKRKREAQGKRAQIQYKGRSIEPGKLERLAKRLKGRNSPAAEVPPHICVLGSPTSPLLPGLRSAQGNLTPEVPESQSISKLLGASPEYRAYDNTQLNECPELPCSTDVECAAMDDVLDTMGFNSGMEFAYDSLEVAISGQTQVTSQGSIGPSNWVWANDESLLFQEFGPVFQNTLEDFVFSPLGNAITSDGAPQSPRSLDSPRSRTPFHGFIEMNNGERATSSAAMISTPINRVHVLLNHDSDVCSIVQRLLSLQSVVSAAETGHLCGSGDVYTDSGNLHHSLNFRWLRQRLNDALIYAHEAAATSLRRQCSAALPQDCVIESVDVLEDVMSALTYRKNFQRFGSMVALSQVAGLQLRSL